MTSLRPAALLIAWSLLVWTTRISNIVADESLDSTGRLWRIVLALSFTVFALGAIQVTWRMRVRPAPEVRRRWSRWMRAFAIWTVLVWTIRGTGIFIGDHPVGFVVVHTVLALVSFVVSAATWRSTAAQSPVAAVSV